MICNYCEKDLPVESFSIRKETGKPRRDCKSCRAEKQIEYYYRRGRYLNRNDTGKNWRKTKRGKYVTYRAGAKQRGLAFQIGPAFFDESKPCHYCGDDSERGYDRVDSSIGYLLTNLVPCCYPCNRMKNNLDYNLFIEKCKKITKRMEEEHANAS